MPLGFVLALALHARILIAEDHQVAVGCAGEFRYQFVEFAVMDGGGASSPQARQVARHCLDWHFQQLIVGQVVVVIIAHALNFAGQILRFCKPSVPASNLVRGGF